MKAIYIAIVLVLACAVVWAQATSQIQGVVLETSGAVIPGVEVKATQTETGITRTALSNEDGRYVLPNLPIGPYKLEVNAPGFGPFVPRHAAWRNSLRLSSTSLVPVPSRMLLGLR